MKSSIYNIVSLLLILLCFSCTEKKPFISDDYYSVYVKYINSGKYNDFFFFRRGYIRVEERDHRASILWDKHTQYSDDSFYHHFYNDLVEIDYTQIVLFPKPTVRFKDFSPLRILIGIRKVKNELKGFYIAWLNRNKDSISQVIYYPSCIGKFTDTLTTNLSFQVIHSLYPDFKGFYKQRKVDSIEIDDSFSIADYKFYNNIKFDNKRIGYPIIITGLKFPFVD